MHCRGIPIIIRSTFIERSGARSTHTRHVFQCGSSVDTRGCTRHDNLRLRLRITGAADLAAFIL